MTEHIAWFQNTSTSQAAEIARERKYGVQQFLKIPELFFEYSVPTLLTHDVIPSQLEGGNCYLPLALTSGMERISASPECLAFYDRYSICDPDALAMFDQIEERTRKNNRYVLWWEFDSEQDQLAPKLAAQYYQEHEIMSDKKVVEIDDSDPILPTDIYIAFNRLRACAPCSANVLSFESGLCYRCTTSLQSRQFISCLFGVTCV